MIPELLNGASHGFPKRVNRFFAFAQSFGSCPREMSRERSAGQPGTIEIAPAEPQNAPGSLDGFACEHFQRHARGVSRQALKAGFRRASGRICAGVSASAPRDSPIDRDADGCSAAARAWGYLFCFLRGEELRSLNCTFSFETSARSAANSSCTPAGSPFDSLSGAGAEGTKAETGIHGGRRL